MANIRKHVSKDGSISYRVQVRYRGISRYETFPTRKDALDWAIKTESEILNKKFFPEIWEARTHLKVAEAPFNEPE